MLVIKSISKSYGVPGIRLGILCSADVEIVSQIKSMVSIWNINSFCEFFMQIYTKYEKDYKRACERFIEARDEFEDKLRKVNFLRVIPSQANYFLVEVLKPYTAKELVLRMLKEFNILMRDCSGKVGFDDGQYMRIAVRDRNDNDKLIEALKIIEK
jgi:histidinol-phosphate/aromatic aminotransferase/cobyric acid decarboxylase-like protein